MSTATLATAPPSPARATTASRSVAVMRMHLVDRLTLVVMPTAILASVLVINWVVWTFVPRDGRNTGGAGSLWAFVLAAAVFAVIRGLPFALGMGASRRAFVLGTALTGLALAVGYGTLMLVLQLIERATDGWGLGGRFVWFAFFGRDAWPVDWLLLIVSVFAAFAVGELIASVWSRWSMMGLVVGGPLAILVLGGGAILLAWQHAWGDVLSWFGDLTPWSVTGLCAALAAACTLVVGLVLRRVRVA